MTDNTHTDNEDQCLDIHCTNKKHQHPWDSSIRLDQPKPTKSSGELEEILDAHAETYARSTMNFITGKLTEDERDKEFHHSDLKTKHAIDRLFATQTTKLQAEARLDELEKLSWHKEHPPQYSGHDRGSITLKERITELNTEIAQLEREHKIGEDGE